MIKLDFGEPSQGLWDAYKQGLPHINSIVRQNQQRQHSLIMVVSNCFTREENALRQHINSHLAQSRSQWGSVWMSQAQGSGCDVHIT